MSALEISGLTRRYGAATVLDRLSLRVGAGELLALLGPSGSGKSTLLKIICGIEAPDAGDVALDGRSILGLAAHRRGAVLMFQRPYLFPFLSVAENIAFGLKVQRASRQRIASEVGRMLELVELPGIERMRPHELSGGQQQRVALARALVVRPRLLLLDEPLSSLDAAIRQTLQAVIRRIQRELGLTAILVTHDLSEAIAMADRTALLHQGAIAACAPPEILFQRPPNRAAARFMGISAFLEGWLAADQLATPAGALQVPADGGAPRPAIFAIRPEHVALHQAPAANSLPGTVRGVLYKGEFYEYQVALAAGVIQVKHYAQAAAHGVGDAVQVEFPARWLFELRDEA